MTSCKFLIEIFATCWIDFPLCRGTFHCLELLYQFERQRKHFRFDKPKWEFGFRVLEGCSADSGWRNSRRIDFHDGNLLSGGTHVPQSSACPFNRIECPAHSVRILRSIPARYITCAGAMVMELLRPSISRSLMMGPSFSISSCTLIVFSSLKIRYLKLLPTGFCSALQP